MKLEPKLRAGLLIAGLIATLAAVYWAGGLPDAQKANADGVAEPTARPARPPRAGNAQTEATAPNAAGLDLGKLQRAPSARPSGDPFGIRAKPAPAARELPPSAPIEAAAAVPPPSQQAPPLPFTYLGRLSEDRDTTVFLAQGERNFVVKPGDVIDNHYRVEEVTDNAVSLTYLPLNLKQTLSTGAK